MKGGYVLNWLIKVAQCLKNGFPIYQDTVVEYEARAQGSGLEKL